MSQSARALLLLIWLSLATGANASETIAVGSKSFAESHVLAEIIALYLEENGHSVERKQGLGGSLVVFGALETGDLDIYPEYTGTLKQVILGAPGLSLEHLTQTLAERQLQIATRLGFDNSYAIAIDRKLAMERDIQRIADLAAHPDLRAAFSHEFLRRADGWEALSQAYGLPHTPVGIEHALAYGAIENGHLDFTDAYTTDGELSVRQLRLLQDNLAFFPEYEALILSRTDLPAEVVLLLKQLRGRLDEPTMQGLNYQVSGLQRSPAEVAAEFLLDSGLAEPGGAVENSRWQRIGHNVLVHLRLTGIALACAFLVAMPLSLLAYGRERAARALLYITGLIQTVPALALLALLIPLLGLGEVPAIVALGLYSLLPIVRNTLVGLFSVDPLVKEVAQGMGLNPRQRLWHIELPLAAPAILAGIKTAAIISIGTATLAAFVGAGGLGEPIITGLTLNDQRLILEGAIPAALLAIIVELLFEVLERTLIPAHLRQ